MSLAGDGKIVVEKTLQQLAAFKSKGSAGAIRQVISPLGMECDDLELEQQTHLLYLCKTLTKMCRKVCQL